MTASDDDQLSDAAKAGAMLNASKNPELPEFVQKIAQATAEKITARLSDENNSGGDAA
jgi:hypothetical protein